VGDPLPNIHYILYINKVGKERGELQEFLFSLTVLKLKKEKEEKTVCSTEQEPVLF